MSDTEFDTDERTMGERMREAFGGIDMKSAMRLTFGKCPKCGGGLTYGRWLRWCPNRTCQGHIGVLNKALGNKVESVAPATEAETEIVKRLEARFATEAEEVVS